MAMADDLVTQWLVVSAVFFVLLAPAFVVVYACVGTLEREAAPIVGLITWMRRHRARHRRGRKIEAQWDIQLAHAGGRYEELPSVAEYDTDTLRLFHDLNAEDVPRPGQDAEGATNPSITGPGHLEVARSSIFDRLSDTDCFAAINWDIHRAVNELAVLQRDLWAGYKLPPWKKWKR